MIHPLSDVQSRQIGEGTQIWQFSIILGDAVIGKNCNINCHTFIENDVIIGDNATIKSGVCLWDGIRIHDNVFIGPNVTFTNDLRPKSKKYPLSFQKIIIQENASVGAGAIILGDLIIGENSMIGAGAVVKRNVPVRALLLGSSARVVAWLNEDGSKMKKKENYYVDNLGRKWVVDNNSLRKYE